MKLPSIDRLKNLRGKTVLLRADFNVVIKKGKIFESERIVRTYDTIDWLVNQGAKVILCSHLGRPTKKDRKNSLKPVFLFLKRRYRSVIFCPEIVGVLAQSKALKLKNGQLLLLENLRFNGGEEKNSPNFARQLAKLADIYVNDAFSASHRDHASINAILDYLPGYAGLSLQNEVINIDKAINNFKRPAVAILGGVKISTKINLIKKIVKKFDRVLIGGALANNFLISLGYDISNSFYEKSYLRTSAELLKNYKNKIVLPVDLILSNKKTVSLKSLKNHSSFTIEDIGPNTVQIFTQYIKKANTLIWNGPLGRFEQRPYDRGTNETIRAFASRSAKQPFGLAGGGETLGAIKKLNLGKKIDFISGGGGAMLEYIEKGSLPSLDKLIKMHAARANRKNN